MAERVWLVATLVTSIVTPGSTAPDSSVTEPAMLPVACAQAGALPASMTNTKSRNVSREPSA